MSVIEKKEFDFIKIKKKPKPTKELDCDAYSRALWMFSQVLENGDGCVRTAVPGTAAGVWAAAHRECGGLRKDSEVLVKLAI